MITERHVFLALEAFDASEEDSELSNLALESIFLYAEQSLNKSSSEHFTDEELAVYVQELIIRHGLEKATKHGYLDTDMINGEVHYHLTEDGEKMVDQLGQGEINE